MDQAASRTRLQEAAAEAAAAAHRTTPAAPPTTAFPGGAAAGSGAAAAAAGPPACLPVGPCVGLQAQRRHRRRRRARSPTSTTLRRGGPGTRSGSCWSGLEATLVCPKCRACFLNIPPQKLLMGASLFLNKQQSAARVPVVGASDILAVVAEGAGIPLSHVSRSDWESLLSLETSLRQQVAGQDAAVHAVAAAVRLGRLGLQRGRRPLASFVLKGPRGVGHGTLCKALTTSLFASERALLRFDLSDCTDRTAVSRLVGAPPGYVGYGDGGTLTEAVRRRPHSVVVFDHADRGHPEVLDLLTQIVEQGQLSDSMGRRIDFRNSTVIFSVTTPATHTPGSSSSNNTSSRGTRANEGEGDSATGCHTQPPSPTSVPVVEHELAPAQRLPTSSHPPGGASHAESTASGRASHNAAALSMAAGGQVSRPGTTRGAQRSELPPEMEAAVDAVIQLESLTPEAMQQIVAMQLQECRQMLEEQGLQLKVGDGVGEWLSGRGMSPLDGALPLQLLLRQHVLGPAAHALLEYRIGLAQHSGQSTAGDDTNCRIAVEVAPGGDLLQLRMAP